MKNDSVSLTIDGKPVQVPAGTTLLLAAKENDIDIPTLCYHPELKPEGHCRLCVVEIGDGPPHPPGEFLHLSGRARPGGADRLGESPGLPAHGAGTPPGPGPGGGTSSRRWPRPWASRNPLQKGDPAARCILCAQCVRTCREVVGVSAISMAFRTPKKRVTTPFVEQSEACIGCGSCVFICPTNTIDYTEKDGIRTVWGRKFELQPCSQMRQLHRPQGPTGTLGQTHRRPGGKLLYVQGLPVEMILGEDRGQ